MSATKYNRGWFAHQPKDSQRSAIDWGVILACQAVIVWAALTAQPESSTHYRAHGALILVSLLVLLFFFVQQTTITVIVRQTGRAIADPKQASLLDIIGALQLLSFMVVVASLFIIDYSAISRYGLTIGGATAVSLFFAFKSLLASWRARGR